MRTPTLLSIVVPTRDRPELLDECLRSVRRSVSEQDEVIVVDSASTSGTISQIAYSHLARYVRCDIPGASVARNTGWRIAANLVVAFLDDDVRVSEGWADAIRHAFESHPEAAFITGQIGVPADQIDTVRPVAVMQRPDSILLRRGLHELSGHSANLAVRVEALRSIGGFDELLGAGARLKAAEDNDLFDRLYAMGYTGRYDTTVLAWHEQWRSRRQLIKLDYSYGFGTGARVAKLLRTNRVHGLKAAKAALWHQGLSEVLQKDAFLAITALARVIGVGAGFLRSVRLPMSDGRFIHRETP